MQYPQRRLSYVQVSRAIAILFVLLGHANNEFYAVHKYDWFNMGVWERTGGVDFFFIVTGFMIYYLYHKQIGVSGKAGEFLLKRAIRILPLYWITTVLVVITTFIFGPGYSGPKIVNSLVFIEGNPVIGSAWSLKHIIFFYLLFAALIFKPRIIKSIIFIWIILTVLVEMKFLFFLESFVFSFSSIEVLLGSLVALLILRFQVKYPAGWIALGLMGFLFMWINNILHLFILHSALFFCISSMLIMFGIAEKDKKTRSVPKVLTFLGDASYSIYIVHGPLLNLFILVLGWSGLVDIIGKDISLLLLILLTTGSCCLVYILIEKPLNTLLKRKLLNGNNKSNQTINKFKPIEDGVLENFSLKETKT